MDCPDCNRVAQETGGVSGACLKHMTEVVDMTLDPADPRFKVIEPATGKYLPGYWPSAAAARSGADHLRRTTKR